MDILQMFKLVHTLPFSLIGLVVTNIILILEFIIGKIALHKAQNAVKFFAYFSVLTCATLVLYFISILWYSIDCLYSDKLLYTCIFPVFLFLPFIIGHFTSYEKVHLYTNIQIFTLVVSLILVGLSV